MKNPYVAGICRLLTFLCAFTLAVSAQSNIKIH